MGTVNLNQVAITGNLTRDPKLQKLPSGHTICEMQLASHRRSQDELTGEWHEWPDYFTVKAFGHQARTTHQHLRKGHGVAISGRPPPDAQPAPTANHNTPPRSSPRPCSSSRDPTDGRTRWPARSATGAPRCSRHSPPRSSAHPPHPPILLALLALKDDEQLRHAARGANPSKLHHKTAPPPTRPQLPRARTPPEARRRETAATTTLPPGPRTARQRARRAAHHLQQSPPHRTPRRNQRWRSSATANTQTTATRQRGRSPATSRPPGSRSSAACTKASTESPTTARCTPADRRSP